ncbi:lipoyl protein ligase domain-containing protein [Sulfolobus acidocaldarius]|uniref:Biotin/lipoate A/B protein ligase family n=4 Tax=Sulfolobus acidocaldarius TaxID=2285 RepID=Q4JBR8_SULAC|nr:lipoate--protein ligase family protein [Sulfolobus acidocaldarius]AAY79761.1 biotin/lipoate A/B protein ligase family [Sulfolobus acidocaldarius DSM 639]AGE70320.1 biotin/lipoate A/B protein ligase [Sulfolobus acidocaldarius N8]AGE72595.1 biotin/lipoate A/B protein ligase [Sulfolobus acidocaldarius Ron12/I]ALU29281.1 ligase [Sulfolobus acidocaldarius]ALU32010.1 ligase [Sulfolobus acidocaldarius]
MREFRFIVERNSQDYILAGEEALLLSVASGSSPVLRFVIFDPPAVLIGYHQTVEQEVNLEEVRRKNWDVGRRPTGGGTIIMGPWQLGWEIYADKSLLGETPDNAMRLGAEGVIRTLGKLGISANFRPKNDVEIKGRKISGIGAFSEGRYMGVTGTILLDFDVDAMVSVLKLTSEKLKDKLSKDFKDRLTWINKELTSSIDMVDLIKIAKEGFSEALGVELKESTYHKEETETINRLARKYSSPEWIFGMRKPLEGDNIRYLERKLPGGLVKVQIKLAGENLIQSVLITGDFFVEPRTAIYDLEARLKWSRVEDIDNEIKEWYKNVKILGITQEDLINLMKEALK